ncbi:hypothetical protein Tco_1568946 [Tanacetum coccineum]
MDQLMLRVFPIFLTGAASHWLRNEPTGSIKTWEDLKNETLFQAWERFKELLMKCPQYYLTEMQEMAGSNGSNQSISLAPKHQSHVAMEKAQRNEEFALHSLTNLAQAVTS